MASLNNFNAAQVEPNSEFQPIPAGKYAAVISNSEMKPTKNGDGAYLELTFQILEGDYKGRLVWSRLNLENPNPTAVKIARGDLSSICRAVNVMEPRDSSELHHLPLTIVVKQRTRPDTGEISNEVKGYEQKDAVQPGQPQQANVTTPPWRRA